MADELGGEIGNRLRAVERRIYLPNGDEFLAPGSVGPDSLAEDALGPYVTSLPGSPQDGQHVYFQAAAGVIWHLRYNASAAGSYKWEFVGGPPLVAEALNTTPGTTSTSYVALTGGPAVTVPLAGDYDVTLGARLTTNLTGVSWASFGTSAGAASDDDGIHIYDNAFVWQGALSTRRRKTGLSAAAVLTAYYKSNSTGVTAYARARTLGIVPVRVG